MPIAKYVQKYFWDINLKKASPKNHPEYYIKRILQFGDEKAFRWLKLVFGTQRVKAVAMKIRLPMKSREERRFYFKLPQSIKMVKAWKT